MNAKMIIQDDTLKTLECEIIAKWKHDNTDYIAYTDGTMDKGKEEVYVAKIIKRNGKIELSLLDEEELKYAEGYLEKELFEEEIYE